MSELNNMIQKLLNFRDQRDWEQFHKSKDLAAAISIEAGELLVTYWRKQAIKYLLIRYDYLRISFAPNRKSYLQSLLGLRKQL